MSETTSATTVSGRRPRTRSPGPTQPGRGSAQERFERHLRARHRRGWRLAGVAILLGLAGLGVWWVLWRSDWALVEQVEVTGAEQRWHAEILAAADIPISEPMVEVDVGTAAARVADVPIVREVEVVRSWPSTVAVQVTEREPVLVVRGPSGDLVLVDEEGIRLDVVDVPPDGLPVVHAGGPAAATEEAYRAAWAVLSTLPDEIAAQVTTATLSSADLVTLELADRTVVWGGPEDSELKGEVVQALLATEATHIDVSAPRSPVTRSG
jgi:cell division protein FtsQ